MKSHHVGPRITLLPSARSFQKRKLRTNQVLWRGFTSNATGMRRQNKQVNEMVVRKLEIPPPISSGPQLDSKFLLASTPCQNASRSDNNFPVGCSFPVPCHAYMRKTYFIRKPRKQKTFLSVSLCSAPVVPRGSLETISPNSSQRGFRLELRRSGKKKKSKLANQES